MLAVNQYSKILLICSEGAHFSGASSYMFLEKGQRKYILPKTLAFINSIKKNLDNHSSSRRKILTPICLKWKNGSPRTQVLYSWRPVLLQKYLKSQIKFISIFSCQKTYYIVILPEVDRIHKKLWVLFRYSFGHRGPRIGIKFTGSCEFDPRQVKLWYHVFSSMKFEEYIESELSDIFQAKLVPENIAPMSMGSESSLQCEVSF